MPDEALTEDGPVPGHDDDGNEFTEADVRAGLARAVRRMRLHERLVDADYTERRQWLVRARRLEKPLTLAELARICGVREEAISQSLRKAADAPPARSPARSNGKPPPPQPAETAEAEA